MIGGFHKYTLIDYPGNISSVIFTQGCNLRCNYCHNQQLIHSYLFPDNPIKEDMVMDYLEHNRNMLDAVVITGGEPTLHPQLPVLIAKVKNQGLKVKLDTNGTNPDMLFRLLIDRSLDCVAMDVKAPFNLRKYQDIAGDFIQQEVLDQIKRSIQILAESKIEHEFRTTVSCLLNIDDLRSIMGAVHGKLYLQKVIASPKDYRFEPATTEDELEELMGESDERLQVVLRGFDR